MSLTEQVTFIGGPKDLTREVMPSPLPKVYRFPTLRPTSPAGEPGLIQEASSIDRSFLIGEAVYDLGRAFSPTSGSPHSIYVFREEFTTPLRDTRAEYWHDVAVGLRNEITQHTDDKKAMRERIDALERRLADVQAVAKGEPTRGAIEAMAETLTAKRAPSKCVLPGCKVCK